VFEFSLEATNGSARAGTLTLPHGVVETPAFMPVGTAGTVKAMLPQSVAETGAQIVLGNTFHLMLRPGAEVVADLGGLHGFMDWSGHVLTDSGGIQEETTALGVPCLTLRTGTERPITVTHGTNRIVGLDPLRITDAWQQIRRGEWPMGRLPELWDGKAASRITEVLLNDGHH